MSSIGRNTTALIRIEMATGAEELLAAHPTADISGAIHDPLTREIAAVAVAPIRQEWTILDPGVAETLAMARQASPEDEIHQLSVSADNRKWVVTSHGPRRPATYLLIDRDKQTLTELFTARPELKSYRLAGMQGVVIKSRDGLDLVSYLTLPASEPESRPITTEAIGSAATHPSLRGALATKQSRGHNMRSVSNPDGRTAAPGLLRFARNDGLGIGSLILGVIAASLRNFAIAHRQQPARRELRCRDDRREAPRAHHHHA